ncbi:hypothetical protein [Maribacter sp.]|uniref:hypothetical protein n=1 Tax=Maribacter sp. TaxID=1897614 RepID=UPI00329A3188
MENNHLDIIIKSKSLTIIDNQIINDYWLIKNGKFSNKPSEIAKKFSLTILDVSYIAREHSHLILKIKCTSCKTAYEFIASSQTRANLYLSSSWECKNCLDKKEVLRIENLEHAKEQIVKRRNWKFNYAIEHKLIENFTRAELYYLLKMIKAPNAHQLITRLKQLNNKEYWRILFKANEFWLIDLTYNYDNSIKKFYLPENIETRIKDYLDTTRKSPPINEYVKPVHTSIEFEMQKNTQPQTIDNLFNGIVLLDRDVTFKAGVGYSYSVKRMENGNAYLSIIPSDNILKVININTSNEPKHISDIIKEL